jgi:hypothetical protein
MTVRKICDLEYGTGKIQIMPYIAGNTQKSTYTIKNLKNMVKNTFMINIFLKA